MTLWREPLKVLEEHLELYAATEALLRAIDRALVNLVSHRDDSDAVFDVIMKGILDLLKGRHGQLLLVEREGDVRELAIRWTSGSDRVGSRVSIEESVSGKAVEAGESLIIDDVTLEENYVRLLGSEEEPIKSELVVPIIDEFEESEVIIGVINIESTELSAFTDRHREILETVAGQASIAIRQVNLQEHFGSVVQRLSTIVRESWPLTKTLSFIWESVQRLVPTADHCQILLLEGNELSITFTTGHEIPGTKFDVERSISGKAVIEGKPQNIGDVRNERELYQSVLGGMRSELAVPILIGGETLGVINAESGQINAFSVYDESILALFADQAAVAIASSRQLQKLEAEQRIHLGLAALAKVGDVAGNMVHRLNNLIGPIPVWIQEIRQKSTDSLDDPLLSKRLEDIERVVRDVLDLVEQVRQKSIEPEGPTEVEAPAIIKQAIDSIRIPANINVIEQFDDNLPQLVYPKDELIEMVRNLVKNAADVLGDGGEITVRAVEWLSEYRTGKPSEGVEILVTDNGPGISQENLDEIWKLGFTTKGPGEGLGYGLWWVRTSIENWGGFAWAKPNPDKGMTFGLKLPFRARVPQP